METSSKTTLNLSDLGITNGELINRIVDRVCQTLISQEDFDTDGEETVRDTPFARRLKKEIVNKTDQAITSLADEHVLPRLDRIIQTTTLQQTNQWGEKQGKPQSFIEYLVSRADGWLMEEVDNDGKTKKESGSSFWRSSQTRIMFLIDKRISSSVEFAVREALKETEKVASDGLRETIALRLTQMAQNLEIKVKTKP